MADESTEVDVRLSYYKLLIGLKTTVEGLLAIPSINVWNKYGGLNRVFEKVEDILYHRMKPLEDSKTSKSSYWNFVQELKWLNPVLRPMIEFIIRSSDCQDDCDRSCHWLRQSLQDHSLATQLQILVENKQHLYKYYYEDGFLCQEEYFQAMLICLKSVELNKVALLTDISPNLLSFSQPKKKSHIRSASLPTNHIRGHINLEEEDKMLDHAGLMALAPPFASPPKESILRLSGECALPTVVSLSSSPEEARETAKTALRTVLRKSGGDSPTCTSPSSFSFYDKQYSDPLLSIEFPPTPKYIDDSVFAYDTNINHKDSSVIPTKRRFSEDIRQRTRSSETVESFLTKSVLDNKNVLPTPVNNLNNSGKFSRSSSLKSSHKRSRSDFSGIDIKSHSVVSLVDNSDQENQSDSTLVDSSGLVKSNQPIYAGRVDGRLQPPAQGQSLMSYLSSQDFHTCANLDKENAHFSISEALIAAIEQMKWNHVIRPSKDSDIEEESDEEIQQLRQRIRIRRRERLSEKARGFPAFSDGRTDTTPSASTSPFSSPYEYSSHSDSSDSGDDIDDEEIELSMSHRGAGRGNLTSLSTSGLSLSMASLYSDADLHRSTSSTEKQNSIQEGSYLSAESVAISLIKKFSEKKLPKASDLEWLVSEQDAPQALLPLPKSYPVSPDDGENSDLLSTNIQTRLRGNLEWAPPRAQIIFNIHPPPKRRVILAKQNYRCAGCGTKVELDYVKRFRYCEYLGKFFCQCCHSNSLEYIPGRIIRKWDFMKYQVSNFARDVLTKIYSDPLFDITVINPTLYRKTRNLESIRDFRKQLYHLRTFLKVCKDGASLLEDIEKLPRHWIEDNSIYSLEDLINVKNGSMLNQLKNNVSNSLSHIDHCQFCQGMGFICEMCHKVDIIFPFQLHKVVLCPDCCSCYHKACFVPNKCPKCARIEARRLRLQESMIDEDESSEDVDTNKTVAQTH
ncbi:hypothetical protein SNE40_000855 [Patella caerulea]|uniref:RUN domain-containing protein n=1 Tax=Patella caerulea TaxID=87958 RepID=A0AAN8QHF5_PATCE